eukprot:jgi/Tetstr1/426958/TSEL_017171.t1
MAELRKLWYLPDSNGVHIRARYIRSAANVWADRLSRHLDSDDWQLDPVMFAELEAMWGAHSVDRFASALNAMLPRYNAAWLDPGCEAKLRQSGAAATVVAPRWEGKMWHQALTEMAVAERVGVPPLGGTAATVARYIAWRGLRGTVKAASLQPYLSAINGFYRDHGAEPVAQGDLISKVRKGLAASQVEPDPPGVRTDVPARLITRTLRLAETLHWLQLVAHMLEEHPPPGFVWTSHFLRKGAATAAYAIGVVLQKIKHFGCWAQLSSVVLDYINPTALPCAASWQLFGWLTPWARPGQRGANAPRPGQRGANAPRPGQRGANAPRPAQRGANAPRPAQRGASAPTRGDRRMLGHIFPWRCRISASPTRISAYGGKSSSLSPIKLRKKHSKKRAFGCRWWESQGHIFPWRCRISASPTRISA